MKDTTKKLEKRKNLDTPNIDRKRESCERPHEQRALPSGRIVFWVVENEQALDLFRHK